jgi:hypothetical protein
MLRCVNDVSKDHSAFKSQELFIHYKCNISEDINCDMYVPQLCKPYEMASGGLEQKCNLHENAMITYTVALSLL